MLFRSLLALGFPLTLMGGFVIIGLSLRYLAVPFQELYDFAIRAMLEFAQPALQ